MSSKKTNSHSFSTRNGRPRAYSTRDLINIVWDNVHETVGTQGLLDEVFGYIPSSWEKSKEALGPAADNLVKGLRPSDSSRVWLNRLLRRKVDFSYSPYSGYFKNDYGHGVPDSLEDLDSFFDFLEGLHDLASRPVRRTGKLQHISFDKSLGQSILREALNDDLALYSTPYRMLENGQIIEIDGGALAELASDGLALQSGKGVTPKSVDAIHQGVSLYMTRGATLAQKKGALQEVIGALESLRKKIKQHLLSEDERDLFAIANGFAIRHNNAKQKSDYDPEVWYDWMFQVNLAALIAVVKILQKQNR